MNLKSNQSMRLFAAIILFAQLNCPFSLRSQTAPPQRSMGAGAELFCSGSGHGKFLVPYITLGYGRSEFMAGPMVHLSTMKTNGLRLAYSLNLSGQSAYIYQGKVYQEINILQLNLLSTVNYNRPERLSSQFIARSQPVRSVEHESWESLRFSTAEAGLGLELRINITEQLSLRSYAMFNMYYHPDYTEGRGHDRSGSTMGLGSSLQFVLR